MILLSTLFLENKKEKTYFFRRHLFVRVGEVEIVSLAGRRFRLCGNQHRRLSTVHQPIVVGAVVADVFEWNAAASRSVGCGRRKFRRWTRATYDPQRQDNG